MLESVSAKVKALSQKYPKAAEIIRFGFTGGVCFVVEFLFLVLFKEVFHMPVLLATALAFLISVVLNYLMCLRWVFDGARESGNTTRVQFLITSGIGLGLNELFMWILAEKLLIYYMIAKVITTLLVMVWNYLTKRLILKRKDA